MSGRMQFVLPVSLVLDVLDLEKRNHVNATKTMGGKLKQLEVIEARDVRFAPELFFCLVEIIDDFKLSLRN